MPVPEIAQHRSPIFFGALIKSLYFSASAVYRMKLK
jgi:hypothetical protein